MSDRKNENDSGASEGIRKGRFVSGMAAPFAKFNASIAFDQRLYAHDIRGSIAHAEMLARQDIISREDADLIQTGLLEIKKEIEQGVFVFRDDLEDIHINIETALKDKIGPVAGRLHTARSRNDQVALDFRLYLRDLTHVIFDGIIYLMDTLVDQAEFNIDVIFPGYTHLQRAQPVRLSHHLMAYTFMLKRDWERFNDSKKRIDVSPLGAAALAGTTFPIDRYKTSELLNFPEVAPNSMDAVSDRDFAVEFVFNSSLLLTHLSRLAEELILWSTSEFGFCVLPDAYCSGSSIMPQKKNPDACELIRGKTGRVYGDLVALLTTLKALPLTYNKDIQEDKEPVFDALDTALGCLTIMAGIMEGITFNRERMAEAAAEPGLAATDLADQLAREGVPFREAHERIGSLSRDPEAQKKESLPTPEQMVEARAHVGGTAKQSVQHQIELIRAFIEQNRRSQVD